MATMYPSSDGNFQQDNVPCHNLELFQIGFLNMTMSHQITISQPIEHLWDVVKRELPTNLNQLQDAILSIWAKISKECFQHLVESMPCIIKAVLKAKGHQTQY